MMQSLEQFLKQGTTSLEVAGGEVPRDRTRFVIAGMGGSGLAGRLLSAWNPALAITLHADYGMPLVTRSEGTLFVASSYSGNTEEVLNFAEEVVKNGGALTVIAGGGALIDFARENALPYIKLPKEEGFSARQAVGYSLAAHALALGQERFMSEVNASGIASENITARAKEIAEAMKGKTPVIYASHRWAPLAYDWKVRFNETSKVPAFANEFPEAGHNEIAGFDGDTTPTGISERFSFLFLMDEDGRPQVKKRMEDAAGLYEKGNLPVITETLRGANDAGKLFYSVALAEAASWELGTLYGTASSDTPIIEKLKGRIV